MPEPTVAVHTPTVSDKQRYVDADAGVSAASVDELPSMLRHLQ